MFGLFQSLDKRQRAIKQLKSGPRNFDSTCREKCKWQHCIFLYNTAENLIILHQQSTCYRPHYAVGRLLICWEHWVLLTLMEYSAFAEMVNGMFFMWVGGANLLCGSWWGSAGSTVLVLLMFFSIVVISSLKIKDALLLPRFRREEYQY